MSIFLSQAEIEQFDRDGFVGPFDVYPREESLARLAEVRLALLDRERAVYDLNHGGNIANYDRHLDIPLLMEHVRRPEIVERVRCILGEDLHCWRTEFFAKFPGDEGTDWHQSRHMAIGSGVPPLVATEPHEKYPDVFLTLAVWTALSDASIESGCMRYLPGSHKKKYLDDLKPMNWDEARINKQIKFGEKRGLFGYDAAEIEIDPSWQRTQEDAVSVEVRAGQCIIFWEATMHASHPNTSNSDARISFVARYVPTSVRIYPNQSDLSEYGGKVDLLRWSPVLVSGVDLYNFNRRGENLLV
ncbi:chlorinating enzyme [Rhizobium leguminosarum]